MNIIQWLVQTMFGGPAKPAIPEPPASENAGQTEITARPEPAPVPFADDDSPPGHRIRWHQ